VHDDHVRVGFRRLAEADLGLLHGWLNEPGVVRWWEGEDVSPEAVRADYLDPGDPTEHWIALVDGDPIGWIQCYATADNAEDDEVRAWYDLGVADTAAGVDYLLGAPEQRGRGLGTAMVRQFVERVVLGEHPGWTQVCASPFADNVASWRALERAGFTHRGDFDDPLGPCRLMVRER
jgi:RimJ/RimL family protein N-acetyltransferase